MAKFEISVEVTDAQIQRAVNKAGKFDSWAVESIARHLVENKLKAKMRKSIGNIDEAIDNAIADVDWTEVIKKRMAQRLSFNDDY